MFLDSPEKSLEVSLDATTFTECDVIGSYADHTSNTFKPGSVDLTTNGTTRVVAVPAPAASVQRQVKEVLVSNPDVSDHIVTLWLNHSGVYRQIMVKTLGPGDTLAYRPDALSGPKGADGATGAPAGSSGTPADFGLFFRGKPDDAQVLMLMPMTRAIELPILLSGSRFRCEVAPTADYTIDINQNGSSVGSILFSAGTLEGVATFTGGVVLNEGDLLEITGASPADATIEDIGVSIRCTFF